MNLYKPESLNTNLNESKAADSEEALKLLKIDLSSIAYLRVAIFRSPCMNPKENHQLKWTMSCLGFKLDLDLEIDHENR